VPARRRPGSSEPDRFPELGREVRYLEDPANLDHRALSVDRAALGPFDRLRLRLDVDDPVAADQLLGLGEGAVDDLRLTDVEADTDRLVRGVQAFTSSRTPASWSCRL